MPAIEHSDILEAFKFFIPKVLEKDKSYYLKSRSPHYFPMKKIQNAIKEYAKSISVDEVLVFYDDTLFGGGTDGFCVTEDTFYYKACLESPNSFKFNTINKIEFDGKDVVVSANSDVLKFHFALLDNKLLADSLEQISGYFENEHITDDVNYADFLTGCNEMLDKLIISQFNNLKLILELNEKINAFSEEFIKNDQEYAHNMFIDLFDQIDELVVKILNRDASEDLEGQSEMVTYLQSYKSKLFDLLMLIGGDDPLGLNRNKIIDTEHSWKEISLKDAPFRGFEDIIFFKNRWYVGAYADPNSIFYSDDLINWQPLDIGEKLEFSHFAYLNDRLFFFNEPISKSPLEKYDCTLHEITEDSSVKKINVDFLTKHYNCIDFRSFMYHDGKYILFSTSGCPYVDEDGNENAYSPAVIAITEDFEHWLTYSTAEYFSQYSVHSQPRLTDDGKILIYAQYRFFGNLIALVSNDCLTWEKASMQDYEQHLFGKYEDKITSSDSPTFNLTSPFPKQMYCFEMSKYVKSFGNLQLWSSDDRRTDNHQHNLILMDTQTNKTLRMKYPIRYSGFGFTYADNKLFVSEHKSLYVCDSFSF